MLASRPGARLSPLSAAIVLALALVLAPAAFAAKGGGGKGGGGSTGSTGSSLTLVLLDSTDGVPHRGERITFVASTTATDRPFVGLRCWQGDSWVYDGYVGYFEGYMFDSWFLLDGQYWTPGVEARCTARLFYSDKRGREVVLATTSFAVAP